MKTLFTMVSITVLSGSATLCMQNKEQETLKQSSQQCSWMNPKLEVRTVPSDDNALGVFTREKIHKGERLVMFGGTAINEQKVLALNQERIKNVLQIDDDIWLSCDECDDTDHIRHSCNPNTGFKNIITLIAMRDIGVDEEITIDFAMVVERFVGMGDFLPCQCKTENCRKLVAGSDWKNKDLQKKYHGYFSPHLQEKIDKLS
jgi:uncharacterized protein